MESNIVAKIETPIKEDHPGRRRRNEYFTFKCFHINQRGCAMKVSSDACVLGAFVPVKGAKHILDIGTGTGLLALMLAQRASTFTKIEAVEIDHIAAKVAQENVALSPFASMIHVTHEAIQRFMTNDDHFFDLIVANPPFYQNFLRSKELRRNIAWHADSEGLNFYTILKTVDRLLTPQGSFWVLMSADQAEAFKKIAIEEVKLYECTRLILRHKPTSAIKRVISCYKRNPEECQNHELNRCNEDGSDTLKIRALLQDYMLHWP